MLHSSSSNVETPLRIGAVTYLNSRPLTCSLEQHLPGAQIKFDLPSRLADDLARGHLDVALIPSIEYARNPNYQIVSDACVACDGPVLSVKLFSRVPLNQIHTLALDEGSRTSAAMVQILLKQQYGLQPKIESLPIDAPMQDCSADAVMLIGDRAMRNSKSRHADIVDLGQQWSQWTGLPFVFAMWIARKDSSLEHVGAKLSAARDKGISQLEEIARLEARTLDIPETYCLDYLRDHLHFRLGPRQQEGLQHFFTLASQMNLAPTQVELSFPDGLRA